MTDAVAGDETRQLGTVPSSELLLQELYIDLRRRVRSWSAVTRQTPQARMGYIGQHLASVVTGFPGGRSGARGHDLELPEGRFAEIKTCYRVDQLGSCITCGAAVSSIEFVCPSCGGRAILRRDDSKWLIGVRNEAEMRELFSPAAYYLVLFDFSAAEAEAREPHEADIDDGDVAVVTDQPLDINARIWQVDPQHPGFALCMVDYRFNIQAKSKSGAPFNLWPYSLKFQLMSPTLIYHAVIGADDSIRTLLFPEVVGTPARHPIVPFAQMRGSHKNLANDKLVRFAAAQGVGVTPSATRNTLLGALDTARSDRGWTDEWLSRELAELMYRGDIAGQDAWLPEALRTA